MTEESAKSSRTYIVLEKHESGAYRVIGRRSSSSAEGAVRAMNSTAPLSDGAVYVAVPERNWTELPPLKLETQTKLRF